jgi:mono/diheme cytochrome c family protein
MVKCLTVILIIVDVSACGKQKKSGSGRVEDPKKGEVLFNTAGCAACHSITGENRYGPPLNSILGKDVLVLRDGRTDTVKVDRQYIQRSLQEPGSEKVLSFRKRNMPAINLTQEEIGYIVDYLIYINVNQSVIPSEKE